MTVDDEGGDFRSKPRWSAGKKMEVVLRLWRGESLDELSRELGVEAHRLAAWRDEFLEAGKHGLKAPRSAVTTPRRAGCGTRNARSVSSRWRTRSCGRQPEKGGFRSRRRSGQVSAEVGAPLGVVCRVLEAPRSTVYARRMRGDGPACRSGPVCELSDDDLVAKIRAVLAASPFCGEGHRKVRARLRREHAVHVGGKRVLRLMRVHGLLAPQRECRRRVPRPHDGTIIPEGPKVRWGADATMA